MLDKVLVLADGDDPNQPALRRALECVNDGGEIEVLAIVYEPMLEGYLGNKALYEPLRRRVLDDRRAHAESLARALESEGVRASAKSVWSHPMHAAVAAEVEASGIGLVVAAPANLHQGHGAGGKLSRGGGLSHSDWQVVTGARVPLLVVKSSGTPPYRNIVAAVDPFHTNAKSAALDREILHAAAAVHRRTSATLSVVHCYQPLEYFGADLTELAPIDPRAADARLAAVRTLCEEAGLARDVAELAEGVPHAALAALQERGRADLVVMGGLARGRLAELILGNTAERLLHYGTGDVLVIPPSTPRPEPAHRSR